MDRKLGNGYVIGAYIGIEKVQQSLVCEDVEGISRPRVDDRQAMDLALHQLLDCVIQTVAVWVETCSTHYHGGARLVSGPQTLPPSPTTYVWLNK